jgi:uncharacterized membrane protein
MGSWKFIIAQSAILTAWIAMNTTTFLGVAHWDPYPFILLNLALSFQAAYTGPFVMISQNRQAAKDRETAENDYATDLRCEKEIQDLHRKLDILLAAIPPERLAALLAETPAPAAPAIEAKPQPAAPG